MLSDFMLEVFARDQGITDAQLMALRRLIAFSTSKPVQDAVKDWNTIAPALDRVLNRTMHKGALT